MDKSKLKVFHGLVNYGTQAGLFAEGLRNLGVDAKSYTKADIFFRQTDYHFKPRKTIFGKSFYYKLWYPLVRLFCFFRFNTFHFYFGATLTKSRWELPFYKLFGKKVIMEYLGNDIRHYGTIIERYNLPDDHPFVENREEHDAKVAKRLAAENGYIDFRLCCLPLHMDFAKQYGVEIDEVLPLCLDLSKIEYRPKGIPQDQIIILHAPTNKKFKGTHIINEACNELIEEGCNIKLRIVDKVTHDELMKAYTECDVFIDQISIGWYGTAALEAMAIGRPTCAFIDERYFEYIDYGNDIPVINIDNFNIKTKLMELVEKKENLPVIGRDSRAFVEKYHDVRRVSERLLNLYQDKVWN